MKGHAGTKLPRELIVVICQLFLDGRSNISIARDLAINRRTVYRYVRHFNLEKPPKPIKHGTHNAYINHTCRCEECRTMHSEYMKDYKQRRRNAAP